MNATQKFDFLHTPSPSPNDGNASPFITWGDVVGTPLHIASEDAHTAVDAGAVSSSVSVFRVPNTPRRELVARKLTEKSQRRRSKSKNIQRKKRMLGSSAVLLTT